MDTLRRQTYFRGRVALYATLKALDVGESDEVAIQAFTCVAVPEGIMAAGARPRYIDIEADGFNMDPGDLERKISPRTKAIIIQHTFGIPADLRRLLPIAEKLNIPVIEDCCHTLASTIQGRPLGTFGIGSFYSFEWGKPVAAGIGGSLQINDPLVWEKVRVDYENYKFPGVVSRMKIEMQYQAFRILYRPFLYWPVRTLFRGLGSMGLIKSNYNPVREGERADDFRFRMAPVVKRRMLKKLNNLEGQTLRSRWVSEQYRERILSEALSHPIIQEGYDPVFARYPLLVKNKQELLYKARRAWVELADWYNTPVHPLKGRDLELVYYEMSTCPNAESRCQEIVTLPVHDSVSQREIDHAIEFLNGVYV